MVTTFICVLEVSRTAPAFASSIDQNIVLKRTSTLAHARNFISHISRKKSSMRGGKWMRVTMCQLKFFSSCSPLSFSSIFFLCFFLFLVAEIVPFLSFLFFSFLFGFPVPLLFFFLVLSSFSLCQCVCACVCRQKTFCNVINVSANILMYIIFRN